MPSPTPASDGDRVPAWAAFKAEVRHRLRQFATGLTVVTAACVIGLAGNYIQQRDIKSSQAQIDQNARRDCAIVLGTSGVFVDFIRKEIALRARRAHSRGASAAVRDFDRAEVIYWTRHTLPLLKRTLAVHCLSKLRK